MFFSNMYLRNYHMAIIHTLFISIHTEITISDILPSQAMKALNISRCIALDSYSLIYIQITSHHMICVQQPRLGGAHKYTARVS